MSTPVEPWPFVESDRHGWPEPAGDEQEFKKQLDLARLEVRKKRTEQEIARSKSETDAALQRQKAEEDTFRAFQDGVYSAVIEVSKGSIDRARASAEFVEKAAAAILAIYTAVLGVTFSISERPLPAKGLIPAIFLGLAILFSAYFLAWLPNPEDEDEPYKERADQSPRARLVNEFIGLMRRSALGRGESLRAAVGSLTAAVVFLAAPFIALGEPAAEVDITWPDAAQAAPQAPEALRAILYQAQVTAAATQEKEAITGDLDWLWWVFAGVALVLIVMLSQFPRGQGETWWARPLGQYDETTALEVLHDGGLLSDHEYEQKKARLP